MLRTAAVRIALTCFAGAALALGACTGDDAGIRRLPLSPFASPGVLEVQPAAVTLPFLGATTTLSAVVATADGGSAQGFGASYLSLDPAVATVDARGVVTAVSVGTTQVVVRVLNLVDTATVAVRRLPASVVLDTDTLLFTELEANATVTATIRDGAGQTLTDSTVTWSSSNAEIAQVSSAGVITAVGQGIATVTAAAGSIRADVRVRVAVGPTTIDVTPAAVSFSALGDSTRLVPVVRDARGDALAVPVEFSAIDTLIAVVSDSGWVSARAVGSTTVVLSADTLTRNVVVTVTQAPESVTVAPETVTLVPGGAQAFTATVLDRNDNLIVNPSVTWTTSDAALVTITSAGIATAVAPGSVTITATSGQAVGTAAAVVIDVPVDSLDVVPDSITVDPGGTLTVEAFFFDSTGVQLVGPQATWTSRDTLIATVDGTGAITGVVQGATWVVAEADAGIDSVAVTVNAPPSEFNIVLEYVGTTPTASQLAVFAAAETRWEEVILGDLPAGSAVLDADACGVSHPAFSGLVDDVHIFVELKEIDGVGGILGQAGPCLVRTAGGLAVVGTMQFDVDDLASLEADGSLESTILHEMAHVLGLGTGTPWTDVLVGATGADPYWPGVQAMVEYGVMGGTAVNAVPVANTGGDGTRDAHWREASFGSELMTGFLNAGANPLSRLTIAAMQDMGYVVDLDRADSYVLGAAFRAPGAGREIADRVLQPRFTIDPSGRIRPMGGR